MVCSPVALPGRNHQYFLRIINGSEGVAFAENIKFLVLTVTQDPLPSDTELVEDQTVVGLLSKAY